MKSVAAALALLVGALSLGPYSARPAVRVRSHDCCCASCLGPGLCPCDPGSRRSGCTKTSDETPSGLETPSVPVTVKLACELPSFPTLAGSFERRGELDAVPHLPVPARRLEKVPIS